MRLFNLFVSLLFVSSTLKAQYITKIDCCLDIGIKPGIVPNDNNTNSTPVNSSTSNTAIINGGFNFKIDASANTSAGVYKISGADTVLVRTLWSGRHYDNGCYTGQWDGKLDDTTQIAANGQYLVQILSNNVHMQYEGGIGNTSKDLMAGFRHADYFLPSCMAFTATKGFYGRGSSEGQETFRAFALNDIQRRLFPDVGGTGTDTYWATTDGNVVYFGGQGGTQNPRRNCIVGMNPNDYSKITFSADTALHVGGHDYNVIGLTIKNNLTNGQTAADGSTVDYTGDYTGLSVQWNNIGNGLFISQGGLNKIQVLNKTTGALLKTLPFAGAGALACTYNGKIWIGNTTGTTGVTRYTINNDFTLTSDNVFIASGSNIAIAVSPVGELAIADNSTQQIKFYNANGTLTYTLGEAGGYANGPDISFNRFMFTYSTLLGASRPYIAYQQDGSFWFGDAGNFRMLHFNADKTYKEQIAFIPSSRVTRIDVNDNTRIFANFLEYSRDYTKQLAGTNGSWTAKRNWAYGQNNPSDYDGLGVIFEAYGRTYSVYPGNTAGQVYELSSTGLRYTGNQYDVGAQNNIRPDGTLEYSTGQRVYERTLLPDNGAHNPRWAANTDYIANPPAEPCAYCTPLSRSGNTTQTYTPGTPKGYVWWYSPMSDILHLGYVKRNKSIWKWKAVPSTQNGGNVQNHLYTGDYPRDGTFDIGNKIRESVSPLLVHGDHIFWNHAKDFFKDASYADSWNFYEGNTGLFVANWTATWIDDNFFNFPGLAGNILSSCMAKDQNSNYYLYNGDEARYSHIHSIKVSGSPTISIQKIPLTVNSSITKTYDPSDMMAKVPFKNGEFYGGYGWSANPSSLQGNINNYPGWVVATSIKSGSRDSVDINFYADGNGSSNPYYIQKDLTKNANNNFTATAINTNNWKLEGDILVEDHSNNELVEVLDANGKILTQFKFGYSTGTVVINGITAATGETIYMKYLFQKFNHFTLTNINSNIKFRLGTYPEVAVNSAFESGANFNSPATFRIRAFKNGSDHGTGSIRMLKFQIL